MSGDSVITPRAPLHPWEWPSKPWSQIHMDFAGPYQSYMFLVIIDAHSKFIDVQLVQSITSTKCIEKLCDIFATHGLSLIDNGTSFTSSELQDFMVQNGIKHVTSAPYHPSSNGLTERTVQSFKMGKKKTLGKSIQEHICSSTGLPLTQPLVFLTKS